MEEPDRPTLAPARLLSPETFVCGVDVLPLRSQTLLQSLLAMSQLENRFYFSCKKRGGSASRARVAALTG